jgi:glycine oxidase
VVGAGIIGLVSAFRLLQDGHAVTVLDPAPARGATWAAAGMIAPTAEIAPGEESNYRLQRRALEAWRALGEALRHVTGEELQIVQRGTLLVGWDASDRRLIEHFATVARGFGATLDASSRGDSPQEYVGISSRIADGLMMPGDAWLNPDQAVRLLLASLDLLGAKIIPSEVTRIESTSGEVRAFTALGDFTATCGLLATGAARLVPGAVKETRNTVRPVRGATLRVKGLDRSDAATLRAFVRGRSLYLVSRPGGYCVLGATADERGEPALEVGELQRLLRDALDVLPSLESAEVLEHRVGFRPASRDLAPFFEQLAATRWAWASGHYRHGVTLAALTGAQVVEFVRGVA